MWAIVGLGNPGPKYSGTRHNIGFDLCDRIAGPSVRYRQSFGGEFAQLGSGSDQTLLLKPMGYMNLSGGPVRELLTFYKVPPENLIVLHDEIDLELGQLKLKQGGGDAGHNGLRSVTGELGTPDYFRVRLGVGKPMGPDGAPRGDQVKNWVLTRFTAEERAVADGLLDRAEQAVAALMKEGLKTAQNRFNS